ncbi:hypothetical protein C8R45DRAFT_1099491 [Mycena sanguinolenta]|nr:hypothetical protein C8R45DRAFT_1099491 [Mycena sanguinolenta]
MVASRIAKRFVTVWLSVNVAKLDGEMQGTVVVHIRGGTIPHRRHAHRLHPRLLQLAPLRARAPQLHPLAPPAPPPTSSFPWLPSARASAERSSPSDFSTSVREFLHPSLCSEQTFLCRLSVEEGLHLG